MRSLTFGPSKLFSVACGGSGIGEMGNSVPTVMLGGGGGTSEAGGGDVRDGGGGGGGGGGGCCIGVLLRDCGRVKFF